MTTIKEQEVSVDKSREEFEKWFKSDYHPDKAGPYIKDIMRFAWQASRKALVVTIPEKVMEEDEFDKGHNCAIGYCAEAIREAGITVKGEGDEQTNVLSSE